MIYNNFNEWPQYQYNTRQAHQIIEKRVKNIDAPEDFKDIFAESVSKKCNKRQYQQMQNQYMTFMRNGFITNSATSTKIIFSDDK